MAVLDRAAPQDPPPSVARSAFEAQQTAEDLRAADPSVDSAAVVADLVPLVDISGDGSDSGEGGTERVDREAA